MPIAHKDKGFANWVMFWRRGKPAVQPAVMTAAASGAETPTPIDPAIEAARIQKLTGGKVIVIARQPQGRSYVKLPGL